MGDTVKLMAAAVCAGAVNGLFGAGGGMVLVPVLSKLSVLDGKSIFPASLAIMLPICLVSLILSVKDTGLHLTDALPYLIGGAVGGICAGKWGQKIPVLWLHRILGGLILWGGIRYLW